MFSLLVVPIVPVGNDTIGRTTNAHGGAHATLAYVTSGKYANLQLPYAVYPVTTPRRKSGWTLGKRRCTYLV